MTPSASSLPLSLDLLPRTGSLCDVGGDDAFPDALGRNVEDFVLVLDGQVAVKRQHDPFLRLQGVLTRSIHHLPRGKEKEGRRRGEEGERKAEGSGGGRG